MKYVANSAQVENLTVNRRLIVKLERERHEQRY